MRVKGDKSGWDGKAGFYVLDRIHLVRVREPFRAELFADGFWQAFPAPYCERLGTDDAVMIPEEEFTDLLGIAASTAQRKRAAERTQGNPFQQRSFFR